MEPYWFYFGVAVLSMVAFALSNGALAYLIGPALKFLFSSGPGGTAEPIRLVPLGMFTVPSEMMIYVIPMAIMVMAIIKGLAFYGNNYYMGYVGHRIVNDLRRALYDHILRLPVKYFTDNPTGTLTSRLTNDVNMLQGTVANSIAVAFRQGLTVIVLIAVIVSMDWKLSIISLLLYPLCILPMIKFGRKMKKVSEKGQVTMGRMTALLHEAIGGVRIVKAFGMEGYETDRFSSENEDYTKYNLKTVKVRSISTPLMETLGAVGFAATIWYAAYRISLGTLAPEDFISFFAAVIMLYQPIKALNGLHLNIQQGLAAGERVFNVIDTETEPYSIEDEGNVLTFDESIEFRGVGFGYGDKKVLSGIYLKVKKGELIAIVGSSGAGKTTFVNLIPRFYDVTGGEILIDGRDIRTSSLPALRSLAAIVSQQVILFNDTVKGNIAYGDDDWSDVQIEKAARAANAHGFVSKLKEGYDTVVGEGGIKLSGGERQRVSIARAILKDAPILIMDEATSSLDSESEHEVQKALNNLMEGRTTFVIAHRLSTVRNADRIIVLGGGAGSGAGGGSSIVEQGKHAELLERGGEYARLHAMQFATAPKEGIST